MKKGIITLLFCYLVYPNFAQDTDTWKYVSDENAFSASKQKEFNISKCGKFFSRNEKYSFQGKFREADEKIKNISVKSRSKFIGSDVFLIEIDKENFTFTFGKYRKQKSSLIFENHEYLIDLSANYSELRDSNDLLLLSVRQNNDTYNVQSYQQNKPAVVQCLLFLQWYQYKREEQESEQNFYLLNSQNK